MSRPLPRLACHRKRQNEPDASLAELGFGLAAFLIIAAAGLYLATALGH